MQRAQLEVLRLAKAKVEDEKLSLSDAVVRVCAERPDLAVEYRCEVLCADVEDLTPRREQQGPPQGPAQGELRRLIAAEMQSEGVTLGEAFSRVGRARPTLAAAYRREVTGAKQ